MISVYANLIFVFSLLLIALAMFAWQRRAIPGAIHFLGLCLGMTVYFSGYAVQLHSKTLNGMNAASLMQYAGIPLFPAFWGLLAVSFMLRRNPGRRTTAALLFIPIVTCVMRFTDHLHGLMYRSVRLDADGDFPLFHYDPGPWYWVHIAYVNLALVLAASCYIRVVRQRQPLYRCQALWMLAATFIPWAGFLVYLVAAAPYNLDVNPGFLFIHVLLLACGLFRGQLFELAPLARSVLFEHLCEPVLVVDCNGNLADSNKAALRELGISVNAVSPIAVVSAHLPGLHEALGEPGTSPDAVWDDAVHGKIWQISRSVLSDKHAVKGWMAVLRDVTKLIDSEKKLSAMRSARHREEERLAIARDLHDDLAQGLAAIHLELGFLSRTMKGGDAGERLLGLKEQVGATVGMVRSLLAELRSEVLEERGLEGTLRWLAGNLQNRCGIPCRCDIDPPSRPVPQPVAIAAYRIAQEALNNVARHSKAREARLVAEVRDDTLHIIVSDDGVGMTAATIAGGTRFGVTGMKERAALCGGALDVESSPEGGVTVHAVLPLKDRKDYP